MDNCLALYRVSTLGFDVCYLILKVFLYSKIANI